MRGSVLLYVVWVVVLLSLCAGGAGSRALSSVSLSERFPQQLQSAYAARAAVAVATLALQEDATASVDGLGDRWGNDTLRFQSLALGGAVVSLVPAQTPDGRELYGLADEERRLNVNTASHKILVSLLAAAGGLGALEAEELAEAIQDWRDPDSDQRPHGAENFYYQSLRDAYACKDGPFENLEELLLVKGMSPQLYERLEPLVTVHGSGQINLNTAEPDVLRALGMSEAGVSGLMYFRAGEDGQAHTSDDRALPSLSSLSAELHAYVPSEDAAALSRLAARNALTVRSTAFRLTAEARAAGEESTRMRVACIIDRQGHVQQWAER